jgi:anti-sigma regulatory factor (Ser/Thr protein kinase)
MAAATRVPPASVSILLPYATPSVRSARRRLSSDLERRGLADDVVADAALVLSEIISNSLKHARPLESGHIRVAWDVSSTSVEIQVSDGGGPTRPYLQIPSLTSVGGRGLAIVATLCTEWGVRSDAGAITVWAMLPARQAPVRPVPGRAAQRPAGTAAPDRLPGAGARPAE